MEFINAKDLPASGAMSASHGIIVLQDGKLRYMTLAEFQNYMASASVEVDDTLTVGGVAADAAAVGKALTVHNLVDNGDFSNPVNTQGAASYSGQKTAIDKWYSTSGYAVVTLNDGYLNIKTTNASNTVYFQQLLDAGKIKSGRKYTVVCKMRDGSVHYATGTASETMSEAIKYITVSGVQLGTIRFKYDSYNKLYVVLFSTANTGGLDVAHVALYEGEFDDDTLPVYCPRGYAVEAAVCGAAGGGLSMELLWKNASIDSSFGENTTITIPNVAGYDAFVIYAKANATSSRGVGSLFFDKSTTDLAISIAFYMGKADVYFRRFTADFSNGTLKFGNGDCSDSPGPQHIIPLSLYGIKGVSA